MHIFAACFQIVMQDVLHLFLKKVYRHGTQKIGKSPTLFQVVTYSVFMV